MAQLNPPETAKQRAPPKMATQILERLLDPNVRYSAMGDFEERFQTIARGSSLFIARLFYWLQIFLIFPFFIKNLIYWSVEMLKNYLKISLRITQRHKGFSFIKISGLVIGMACCILILLFVRYELSFDDFHENKDRIYRVLSELDLTHGTEIVPITALPLAPAIKYDLREVASEFCLSCGHWPLDVCPVGFPCAGYRPSNSQLPVHQDCARQSYQIFAL